MQSQRRLDLNGSRLTAPQHSSIIFVCQALKSIKNVRSIQTAEQINFFNKDSDTKMVKSKPIIQTPRAGIH